MRAVAVVLASILAALSGAFIATEVELRRTYRPAHETVRAGSEGEREEGRRLAKLYGCTSCHGAHFRGLRYNSDPKLVTNYAPNLTLSAARYSDAQLAVAVRQGIRPGDGRALWGMPSATFRTVTDAELGAVLAYLRSFPPSGRPTPVTGTSLEARIAVLWGMLLSTEAPPRDLSRRGTQQPTPVLVAGSVRHTPVDAGAQHALGRHLALTICSECHGSDLAGDALEGGPDLRIAAAYDGPAFQRLMRTGVPPDGRDLGLMSETAREDLRVLSDGEIAALHSYLVARAR